MGQSGKRLDRTLGNRRWSEAYPLSRVSYMARGRSDHNPLLIRCAGYRVRSSCFRFLNVWHRHPQFREIVSDAWSEEVYGMEMSPQEDNELMKRLPTMEEIHENFFQGMEQPKSWSHSMVVLIPKVEVTSHWQDFRPISLCNVSSKIVSKILAIRISKLLPKLISPWQTRFVPGRGIVDNVLKGAPGTSSVLSC
nr:uncharacterized protein LOC113729004 [Coffea arabica]